MESYYSDKPVSIKKDDKFQRYPFAERIAKTISNLSESESLVIGIYGSWGEGKTSVINFIDTVLSKNDNIIRVKFNPWRYNDENHLLKNYFQILANSLGKKLKKKKIRSLIDKYTLLNFGISIASLTICGIPIGINLKPSFKKKKEDIEDIKRQIEEILLESKKRIVIFIDDIDRLDKEEIHSIFRLVKLTGDFKYTTYVLAFDDKVVANSIGERYGCGDFESGKSFLEKIIQVPLNLPKAQPDALKDYCLKKIDEIFNNNELTLDKEVAEKYLSYYNKYFLQKFETPRLIVRYINALSFSVPLLYGEVNTGNLMVIEAIKILYPDIYFFIKKHPDYILNVPIKKGSIDKPDEEKMNEIIKSINEITSKHPNIDQQNIKDLLRKLFPQVDCIFRKTLNNNDPAVWYNDKLICSGRYFNRYFSYCVIKGEVSDVSFEKFIQDIETQEESEIKIALETLMINSSWENFTAKLFTLKSSKALEWNSFKKLSLTLVKNIAMIKYNPNGYFLNLHTPIANLLSYIFDNVANRDYSKDEKKSFLKSILLQSNPIPFAYNFLREFDPQRKNNSLYFSDDEFKELCQSLTDRVLTVVKQKKKDLFELYPEDAFFICKYWGFVDKEKLNEYIKEIVNQDNHKILVVLRAFFPVFQSLGEERVRQGSLTQDHYNDLTSIINKDYIANQLLKLYDKSEIEEVEVLWSEENTSVLSDIVIVRQFFHWYNERSAVKGDF